MYNVTRVNNTVRAILPLCSTKAGIRRRNNLSNSTWQLQINV